MDEPAVWYGIAMQCKGLTILKGSAEEGLAKTRGIFDWRGYLTDHIAASSTKNNKHTTKRVWVHVCDSVAVAVYLPCGHRTNYDEVLSKLILAPSSCRLRYVTSQCEPFHRPGPVVKDIIIPDTHLLLELSIQDTTLQDGDDTVLPSCMHYRQQQDGHDDDEHHWLVGIDIVLPSSTTATTTQREWMNINRHDTLGDLADRIIHMLVDIHIPLLPFIISHVMLASIGLSTTTRDYHRSSGTHDGMMMVIRDGMRDLRLLHDLKWTSCEILRLHLLPQEGGGGSTMAAAAAVIYREDATTIDLLSIPTCSVDDDDDDDEDDDDGTVGYPVMLWDRVRDHNDIKEGCSDDNNNNNNNIIMHYVCDDYDDAGFYDDDHDDDHDDDSSNEDYDGNDIDETTAVEGSLRSFIDKYKPERRLTNAPPGHRFSNNIHTAATAAPPNIIIPSSSSSSHASDGVSDTTSDDDILLRSGTVGRCTYSTWCGNTGNVVLPAVDKKLLLSTRDTRQFEFHPTYDNILLTGHRSGNISIIDINNDECIARVKADDSPILGLTWFNHLPTTALYGASPTGNVGYVRYNHHAAGYQDEGVIIKHCRTSTFKHLSSISINATDDYFMTSGFVPDVALFDTTTGSMIGLLTDIHSHFINILRFANHSPHIFATSSFDHTCKIWDLRLPNHTNNINSSSSSSTRRPSSSIPVFTAYTGCLNVMCTFNRDDTHLLCSGLDDHVLQFDLRRPPNNTPAVPPSSSSSLLRMDIRALHSRTNYRRSVYLADGNHLITAGTDEDYYRIMNVHDGSDKGNTTTTINNNNNNNNNNNSNEWCGSRYSAVIGFIIYAPDHSDKKQQQSSVITN
ncbi:hypothetical protein FOZ61_007134 [Perkinsus olseni]|uniref:Uncharacterized protein n=1 Tax=Perkinsus olseni TaxID=32597 RepID=A0A7J6LAC4_PEROL|nr:hypothetical protein FOZ61_007134 [Perkinsus olseni]